MPSFHSARHCPPGDKQDTPLEWTGFLAVTFIVPIRFQRWLRSFAQPQCYGSPPRAEDDVSQCRTKEFPRCRATRCRSLERGREQQESLRRLLQFWLLWRCLRAVKAHPALQPDSKIHRAKPVSPVNLANLANPANPANPESLEVQVNPANLVNLVNLGVLAVRVAQAVTGAQAVTEAMEGQEATALDHRIRGDFTFTTASAPRRG
jgi:hypothetical protein